MLLDFTADATEGQLEPLALRVGAAAGAGSAPAAAIQVQETSDGLRVQTGSATFGFRRGGSFPFSAVGFGGVEIVDAAESGLRVGHRGRVIRFVLGDIVVHEQGPLRVEIGVRAASADAAALPLEIFGRVEFFAGTATARISITFRNTKRAAHPGGIWVLGDSGSMFLDFASVFLTSSSDITQVRFAAEPGSTLEQADTPFEIYQDSSGGEHWNHRVHVNRHGVVPARFRGYRVEWRGTRRSGLRSSPIMVVETGGTEVAIAVPEFWQNCPRAVSVAGRSIEVGFFPRQHGDVHELQGGEQKTHVVVMSFASDGVSDPSLAWCHDPIRLYPAPEYCCATRAVPYLTPANVDDAAYRSLVEIAWDSDRGFLAKRERFDEYGWRHFGDIPGDHESAFQPPDEPFVSHYNNQYDAVAAFAQHFLRSGDVRWWRLMDELARHVRDVDIYHTNEDKAAYNGGLFWHTQHYMDASTASHRTYPRGSGGGGPSAEHNYATGFLLHYFLTGDLASRDAAIGLGRWVIGMDDGRLTPFKWLASGPTGLASSAGSMAYHGPGRGSANCIVACLVAHRLSGDRTFVEKADELIRRCIHPADDIEARDLFDVERRWYYTVFLQALALYLHDKADRGELDEMYAYARTSLLHYVRWMATHERPYLSRPELLEYPTETWVAQDVRKADVLFKAAAQLDGQERLTFLRRAEFFYKYVAETLNASPTRHFTRPLVLILAHSAGWGQAPPVVSEFTGNAVLPPVALGAPTRFEAQRTIALRRVKRAGGALAVAIFIGIGALVLTYW
jgi:hypothetical protein